MTPHFSLHQLALAAITITTAMAAGAQESNLPLWEVGIVGGVASTPAYPGSTDRTSRALALPFFIYRGEIFRADRGTLGARLVHTDDIDLDIGFAASLPASSNDVPARSAMPDLGTLIEFGPRLKMTLAKPSATSRVRLEVPLRAALEIGNGVRGQGLAFAPDLIYETRDFAGGWGLAASAGVLWGDRTLNNYFYGVAPQFATATRPAYDAQSGLIASRLSLTTSKDLGPDLRFFGFVRFEGYGGSANGNSPLFANATGTSVGLALAWTLGRSDRRAAAN